MLGGAGTLLWSPKSEVDAALQAAREMRPEPERFGLSSFNRFDKDQSGWLDDNERLIQRNDLNFQREHQAALDPEIQNNLKAHKAEWDALFQKIDDNHDGKLSAFELAAAAKDYPQAFGERLRGINNAMPSSMRPFDLDDDLHLSLEEFRLLLAEPRLVAEVNRSLDWLRKFNVRPEACDRNNNNFLDPEERALVSRLIRQQMATRKK